MDSFEKLQGTILAAQEQALCSKKIKNVVYEENVQSICRACGVAYEANAHIVSGCPKLIQKYKQVIHNNVPKLIHGKLCEKLDSIKYRNGTYINQKMF